MSHVERAPGAGGSALRRRERRLRSFWRHEQMAVQMVLATVTHHSFGKVGTAHAAPRGQKQGTRTVKGEEHELYHTAKFRTTPLPAGGRPAPLSEVAGRQVKGVRHSGKQLIDRCSHAADGGHSSGFLSYPGPAGCRAGYHSAQDLTDRVPQRLVERCFPQLVEQLVEVPTIISYSSLFQQTLEQNVDIPTSVHEVSGSLHGFPPEQSSAQRTASQIADIPVPGSGVSGSLQGFPPGQYSSQRTATQIADIAVPGRGVYGSPQGSLPEQSTAKRTASQIADIPVPGRRGPHGSLPGQSSAARFGTDGRGGGLQGSVPGQSSSSRRGDERAEVPKIMLLLRMGTDSKRYRVPPTQPLRIVFQAYCRRLGLQESQVRFYCDGLLSPDHSPDLLGLEDGDVIEAEEVFVEDEEEEDDDDDHDEFDGTESRFPDGFLPMRMCRWFPSGNCRQGWGCMFAHSVSELHPLAHGQDP